MRWLKSLPWVAGGLALLLAGLKWLRKDAAKDALKDSKLKDKERAHEIADRVREHRSDPKRMRQHAERGYRD